MQEYVEKIINNHLNIFGNNPELKKINIGFTNTIYSVSDKFIIKLCTNQSNENNFKKEIDFYKSNSNNPLIQKLYYSSTKKDLIPYYYEILEQIEGVSLYNVWHTFTEEKRQDIIKQLCNIMKEFHKEPKEKYDWLEKQQSSFQELYKKAKELNIFTKEEQELLDYAYNKFPKYLSSKEFVLVHNDLHFDNIFYHNGTIKIIDFERAIVAPKDFELAILYRMIRKPWKFASEETEKLTDTVDYANIKLYIAKYYPEIVEVPYLDQRLAIYDLIYNLNHLLKCPEEKKLKEDVLEATKIINLKDELSFENITTPEQLMDFMNLNIEYGWIDKSGDKHLNTMKHFRENYRTSSTSEILETGIATCIGQAKLIKEFFDRVGLENKLYCHRSYEITENYDKKVRMHCFVLYKSNNNWYHFEHSNVPERGITKYNSLEQALKQVTSGYEKNDIRELTEIPTVPSNLSFKEFNLYVNGFKTIEL